MRVLLADPPAFTPQYDHALASALARAGAEVELVTSPFRFGDPPEPDGYRRSELFYPVSSRVFRRSRLRIPLKLLEHPVGLARLRRRRADVAHLQWLAAPELDDRLLRLREPLVFTAHDLLPRRTAEKRDLWRRLFGRFERIVVHSERGRDQLAALAGEPERLRVIPHPVFPSNPPRTDDGRTLLCSRDHPRVQGHRRRDRGCEGHRRTRASSSPAIRWRASTRTGPRRATRPSGASGYLSDEEVDRALGDATVALFPYRPEIDQSGALLRALGAGVPVVAYDVGGLGEPVRRFGAGRVVPAGDVAALTEAVRELLEDPQALEEARAGAQRARQELTWDASAHAHLELYRELTVTASRT